MLISKESIKELEFEKVLAEISQFAYSPLTKHKILNLSPIVSHQDLLNDLNKVNEYVSSFENENTIPWGEFEDISQELETMGIENYQLSEESFLKIYNICKLVYELKKTISKFNVYYPTLHQDFEKIDFKKEIPQEIIKIINKFGEVKSSASVELAHIRNEIQLCRKKIQDNFSKSLAQYSQLGYLDDIKESIIDDHRVLAVLSAYKKRVKGRVFGESKSGSITYIEPESILKYSLGLKQLLEEEKKEINKILKELTYFINLYQEDIQQYYGQVLEMDFIQAKAKYARLIHGILPEINETLDFEYIDAYHPILWLRNREEGKETKPQTIGLNKEKRIICISGPNAGGKSITLKTIGLLQCMIQSGILIPVHPRSKVSFFKKILTDIGDNQSIENHLSTYSSRLKKMSQIIRKANENTLLLIDEFGTGSDPELGGALAEAFLEFFYEKGCFGVITTHYTNIKIKIEELEQAINAAMLFDEKDLQPIYKLEIGQAGSSFTFEVAIKNNIPFSLINRAKKKIESEKVSLDKTIVKLQQEKFQVNQLKTQLNEEKTVSIDRKNELDYQIQKYRTKLDDLQKLYIEEQKINQLGVRFNQLITQYTEGKTKKDVIKGFLKSLEQEKHTKLKKTGLPVEEKKKIIEDIKPDIKLITPKELVKIKEEKEQKEIDDFKKWVAVGKRVKIKDSATVATIEKIEKEFVFLNYGNFTTKIKMTEIEKV